MLVWSSTMPTAQLPWSVLALAAPPVVTALSLPAEWPHHCLPAWLQLPQQQQRDLTYTTHAVTCKVSGYISAAQNMQNLRRQVHPNWMKTSPYTGGKWKFCLSRKVHHRPCLLCALLEWTFSIVPMKTVHNKVCGSSRVSHQGIVSWETHFMWIFLNVSAEVLAHHDLHPEPMFVDNTGGGVACISWEI